MIFTSSTVVRPPRPWAPIPSALTLSHDLEAQFFDLGVIPRAPGTQLMNIDGVHQGFFRQ